MKCSGEKDLEREAIEQDTPPTCEKNLKRFMLRAQGLQARGMSCADEISKELRNATLP